MPLYQDDIATMLAVDIGQHDLAGGRMGRVEVRSHQVGNVFGQLGREDRAAGSVRMQKAFLWGNSADRAEAHNAATVLETRPGDAKVSVVLFRPGTVNERTLHADRRADAQDYIESYLVQGSGLQCYPWGQHAQAAQLRLYYRDGVLPPAVGDVLYMGGGDWSAIEEADRYYQVIDAAVEVRSFTMADGDSVVVAERNVVYCTLNKPLALAFAGTVPEKADPNPAALGTSVFDTVTADVARFFGVQPLAVAASAGSGAVQVASVVDRVVPTAVTFSNLGLEYAVRLLPQQFTSGPETFTVSGMPHSLVIDIAAGNRAESYTRTLVPEPAVGTIQVHYRALGRWYTIREQANDPYGSIVRLGAGAVTATLKAGFLPDADTGILWLWATPVHYTSRAGAVSAGPVIRSGTLPVATLPGSVSLAWTSGGVAKAATINGAGAISGHATGYLDHATGAFWVDLTAAIPDFQSSVTWTYDEGSLAEELFTGLSPAQNAVNFSLAGVPAAGSLTLTWETQRETVHSANAVNYVRWWYSSGDRNFFGRLQEVQTQWGTTLRQTYRFIAAVDHNGAVSTWAGHTGALVGSEVLLTVVQQFNQSTYSQSVGNWDNTTTTETFGGWVIARYIDGATPVVQNQTWSEPQDASTGLAIDLLPGVVEQLVPGSVRFRLGTVRYSDRSGGGILYWDDGTVAGALDYVSGRATLTRWGTASATVTVLSAITTKGEPGLTNIAFRTSAAPLVAGELGIAAAAMDGDSIAFQVPSNGVIANDDATGTGRHDIGLVQLSFADPVWPTSLRYTGTVRKTLPLDRALLGLDPTRLANGLVPIYRVGDLGLVFEWKQTDAPNSLLAGQVISTGDTAIGELLVFDGAGERTTALPTGVIGGQTIPTGGTHLEYCVLRDAKLRALPAALFDADLVTGAVTMANPLSLEGYDEPVTAYWRQRVRPDLYEVNTAAGSVTMATPLDLSAYTQPLLLRWRVEDETPITDVQITGELTLMAPLAHSYSLNAMVASKLRHGNLQSRVDPPFSLNTWSGTWTDGIGSQAPPSGGGNYDSTSYPMVVTNAGAITEQWRLTRQSNGTWAVIGRDVGQLAVWDGLSTLEVQYQGRVALKVFAAGLGGGWATGNTIRVNTYGCMAPFWLLQCVQPGAAELAEDGVFFAQRVDVD